MPQNGQVVEINCAPTWKKMRKVLKHYLSLSSSSSRKL